MVQWTETCRQNDSVDYQYMLCFDWINYFIIIQHDWMAPIKNSSLHFTLGRIKSEFLRLFESWDGKGKVIPLQARCGPEGG